MFSGIVEAKAKLLDFVAEIPPSFEPLKSARIIVEKPKDFKDIKIGDSIAVNGVCLTLEAFDDQAMQFALGAETLMVTGWNGETLSRHLLNLERSLRLGDRIHGHIVTGHVDGSARIASVYGDENSRILKLEIPAHSPLLKMIRKKGSVCVNGVSLTVNEVHADSFEVCLIPETLKRTQLSELQEGDEVLIEVDQLARGLVRFYEERGTRELHT